MFLEVQLACDNTLRRIFIHHSLNPSADIADKTPIYSPLIVLLDIVIIYLQ